jgi:hypothetical protein
MNVSKPGFASGSELCAEAAWFAEPKGVLLLEYRLRKV